MEVEKKFVMACAHLPFSPALRVCEGQEPLRIGVETRGPNSKEQEFPFGDILSHFRCS